MEEVWKDINLTSLSDNNEVDLSSPSPLNPNNHTSHHNTTTNNFTLQDFFSRPYARDTSQPRLDSPNIMPSTPQNVFNLNTTPSFDFPDSLDNVSPRDSLHFHNQNCSNVYGLTSNHPRVIMSLADAGTSSNGGSVDRRLKRMIKNRESAARSRFRRQAYTTMLENQLQGLREENEQLKEKNKQIDLKKEKNKQPVIARTAAEIPKRHPMFRYNSV